MTIYETAEAIYDKNERRLDLIAKKFGEGLAAHEEVELLNLTREVHEHIRTIDPRFAESLDEIDARFDRIEQRLA